MHEGFPSWPKYLFKASPHYYIFLGIRISTYKFWKDMHI